MFGVQWRLKKLVEREKLKIRIINKVKIYSYKKLVVKAGRDEMCEC